MPCRERKKENSQPASHSEMSVGRTANANEAVGKQSYIRINKVEWKSKGKQGREKSEQTTNDP
jgi:hypothetical protein